MHTNLIFILQVTPPLGGVVIIVKAEKDSLQEAPVVSQTETDSKGHYRIGPLQPGEKYRC